MTGRFVYRKVLGSKNPADILTKHVPGELLDRHLETLGAEVADGRAEAAPELSSVESVVQWVEDRPCRQVRFSSKVQFRAIESRNRGRKCSDQRIGKARALKRDEAGHDGKAPKELQHRPQQPRRWADIEENGESDWSETAEQVFLRACTPRR